MLYSLDIIANISSWRITHLKENFELLSFRNFQLLLFRTFTLIFSFFNIFGDRCIMYVLVRYLLGLFMLVFLAGF